MSDGQDDVWLDFGGRAFPKWMSAERMKMFPIEEGDRPDWIDERHDLIFGNPVGSGFAPCEMAYWNLVLRACQEALDGNAAAAVTYLHRVECWDWEHVEFLRQAVMISPHLTDEGRRAALMGAVRMANAWLLDIVPAGDTWIEGQQCDEAGRSG